MLCLLPWPPLWGSGLRWSRCRCACLLGSVATTTCWRRWWEPRSASSWFPLLVSSLCGHRVKVTLVGGNDLDAGTWWKEARLINAALLKKIMLTKIWLRRQKAKKPTSCKLIWYVSGLLFVLVLMSTSLTLCLLHNAKKNKKTKQHACTCKKACSWHLAKVRLGGWGGVLIELDIKIIFNLCLFCY